MQTLILALIFVQVGAPVAYEVSFPNAVHHEAEVRMRLADVPAGTLHLRMSRASPGRYALHEFAKNVYEVRAFDGAGRPLPTLKPDPYGWDVFTDGGTVMVTYTLYADHADGTYSGIDSTHAHLNMPATFLWARGFERGPHRVKFRPPLGSGWQVATQLAPTADPFSFTAPDLDYFLDSPCELSDFELRVWRLSNADSAYRVRVAAHHLGTAAALDEYVAWTARLVEEAAKVFGEYPRFDFGTYTFIADYLPWVDGDGMEHRNSTILTSSRGLETSMRPLLGTVAHEFVHAWNIERIRPRSLEPFDFERANMSRELWFGEGFTSYYGRLLQRRAGLIDDAGFARSMSNIVSTVMRSPARRYHSVVGMSMQAPFVDEARHVDPMNRENTFISYYSWGAALALALDLSLRTHYPGLDLDAYMRAVWQAHGVTEIPYEMDDLERLLAELTGDPEFARSFFEDYIYNSGVPDFHELLDRAGFLLVEAQPRRASFGWLDLRFEAGGAVVASPTIVGTPVYEAGVDRGDLLLRVDGRRLSRPGDLESIIEAHSPGDQVEIEFEQRGRTKRTTVILAENDWLRLVTYEEAGRRLDDRSRALRSAWLGPRAR